MRVYIVFIVCAAILIAFGLLEKKHISEDVSKIPLRVNVNGIRGKSTATRFITAILEEAGYNVIGKTTGTSARMIFWGKSKELSIKRRPVGPNIGEQISVLKKAVRRRANALVCECMAVNPEYQEVYQKEIIQANVVVITNVVEDHLDEMGPTTKQIAWAFAKTIPYDGILVITEGPYAQYFTRVAQKRNTKVVCLDPEMIKEDYIKQFPYIVFQNNCAIGLAFARAMGIDDDVAFRAMLKAHPDPGSAQVVKVPKKRGNIWLVNAFAANEPTSSLEILENVKNAYQMNRLPAIMLCCRDDRVDRTHQFVDDFLPYVKAERLIVIGTGTLDVISAFQKNQFPDIEECVDLTGKKEHDIISEVNSIEGNQILFCVGNIHGVAEEFLRVFAKIRI